MLFVKLINKYIVDCSSYKKVIILFQLLSIYQINVFPSLSFHSFHPLDGRPVQKSAAVLGLEKVLSESIVQMPLFKVAYSSTILSPLCFPCKRGTQLLADAAL